jgi:hypothetical protein
MGRIDVVVSNYGTGSEDDSKKAVNTTVKIVPHQNVFNVGKGILIQYHEIQQGIRLPNPRPMLKPINVLPDHAPIFHAVQCGDTSRVRDILNRGEASLYDQRSNGLGLLHVGRIGTVGFIQH